MIDTPGFGDTHGLQRDQDIVDQIRELFSDKSEKGVSCIDDVRFLAKAPDARLTAIQKYIFQSVMSLFGKDICSMITFADGMSPPVLALSKSGLPFGQSFTFNSSGLFASNDDTNSLAPMFWEIGIKSFKQFYDHLETVETKSLQLTKYVLNDRKKLELTVRNLQPQLDAGLAKVNQMKQEKNIFEDNQAEINNNTKFEYEVTETRQTKKELPRGQHVTNCTHCHVTCHENCALANDNEKKKCCAMNSEGFFQYCPDNCFWEEHANTPYIFFINKTQDKENICRHEAKVQRCIGKTSKPKTVARAVRSRTERFN